MAELKPGQHDGKTILEAAFSLAEEVAAVASETIKGFSMPPGLDEQGKVKVAVTAIMEVAAQFAVTGGLPREAFLGFLGDSYDGRARLSRSPVGVQ